MQQQQLVQQQQQRYSRNSNSNTNPNTRTQPPQQQLQQQQYYDRSSLSSSSGERHSNRSSSFDRDSIHQPHHPRSHRGPHPYAHRCDPRAIRTLPEEARLVDGEAETCPRLNFCRQMATQRNGRSSDPLSTDQGYDTDSQMQNRREITPPRDDIQLARRTTGLKRLKSKSEGGEDSTDSENDREVENIIGFAPGEELADPMTSLSGDNDEAIDTARGGLISPTDTVTSWAAVSGLAGDQACFVTSKQASASDTSCSTSGIGSSSGVGSASMHMILAKHHHQQQQQQQQHAAAAAVASGAAVDYRNSSYGSGSGGGGPLTDSFCSYTLPGTSDAATKARIDLRKGGINMTTNL